MGIFLIVAADFVTTGGMDRANHALASYLAHFGNEVHLVAHRVADDLRSHRNVIHHHVPKPAGSYFLGEPLLDRIGRFWAKRISSTSGRVIVNGGNCQWADVNWVHYVHAAYTPSVSGPIPRRLKAKVAHKTFLARESRAIHQATVVIANSERTRRDVIELLGVSEDRVHTVYYGIDPDIFKPATTHTKLAIRTKLNWEPERPVVAFVGALGDRRKGFDILFDAWLALCNDPSWDTDLAVIGAGSELAAWRDRAAAAKIDKRIRFLGFRNDVPMILQACDALASPTRYEAYGLAVHEALCCGLPAFVPASAGVAELYSENLRTWTIRNVESSAEWIDRLRAWRSNLAGARAAVAPFASSLRARDWNVMSEAIVRRMG